MPKENLKKSKSAEHLEVPKVELARSKSDQPFLDTKYPYTTLISQGQELERLEKETQTKSTTISLLRKKIGELEKQNPPLVLLSEQLKEKQKVIELLRKEKEDSGQQLKERAEQNDALLVKLAGAYEELNELKEVTPESSTELE